MREHHRAVLATRRPGGIQQSPVLVNVDAEGRAIISSRETAYKVINLRRDPWARLLRLHRALLRQVDLRRGRGGGSLAARSHGSADRLLQALSRREPRLGRLSRADAPTEARADPHSYRASRSRPTGLTARSPRAGRGPHDAAARIERGLTLPVLAEALPRNPNRADRSRSPHGLTIPATSASSTARSSCRPPAYSLQSLSEPRYGCLSPGPFVRQPPRAKRQRPSASSELHPLNPDDAADARPDRLPSGSLLDG